MDKKLLRFILLLCLILGAMRVYHLPVRALTWDIFGYYLYLPAHFVHDDILLEDKTWQDELMNDYRPSTTYYQLVPLDNGKTVIKYSMGQAMALSPFYFLSDWAAGLLGYEQDGFSLPYQLGMSLGGLLYAFLGLYLLASFLARYFDVQTVVLALGILYFGTNYLHLTAWDGTLLSHNTLFTFYALLLWATDRWHRMPHWREALLVGFALGMITIIRPSEGVALLIPLLWNMGSTVGRTRKWEAIHGNPSHVLLLVLLGLVVVSPQLFYWKAATGQWFFFSYQNAGEGLDLSSPHTWDFLFSYRKGWFLYTPLMLLAIGAYYVLWKRQKALFWACVIFLVVDVYVVSSWTTWWYAGGSFSARAMVPAYTIMALPLACLLDWLRGRAALLQSASAAGIALLILLNLFQTWQFQSGILDRERMTKEYYWAIFGKLERPPDAEELLLVDRSFAAESGGFDIARYEETLLFHSASAFPEGLKMSGQRAFVTGQEEAYASLIDRGHAWFVMEARVLADTEFDTDQLLLVAEFSHQGQSYHYRSSEGSTQRRTADGHWAYRWAYLSPEVRSPADVFKTYLWYRGEDSLSVSDYSVRRYSPRK